MDVKRNYAYNRLLVSYGMRACLSAEHHYSCVMTHNILSACVKRASMIIMGRGCLSNVYREDSCESDDIQIIAA